MALAALIALLGLDGIEARAQKGITWKGAGGWGHGTPYGRMYDPQSVVTIRGVVVSLDSITPMRGMSYGVHATLRTAQETVPVHQPAIGSGIRTKLSSRSTDRDHGDRRLVPRASPSRLSVARSHRR